MERAYASVRYRYCKTGAASWTSTSWAGYINSQSETILMQELRKKHPGCEVELKEVKWK
jgi:hypothetical protein